MTLDTIDSKDIPQDNDVSKETADASDHSLSPSGQRAMQGDDTAALEQRVEQLRTETEAREAAQMAELDQQAAERTQMAENRATTVGTDVSPDLSPDHHPQFSTTERGNEVKIEGGPEMNERKLFSDIDMPDEEEKSMYREGRLR